VVLRTAAFLPSPLVMVPLVSVRQLPLVVAQPAAESLALAEVVSEQLRVQTPVASVSVLALPVVLALVLPSVLALLAGVIALPA
jgi:hypothetical protein